ncbi:MAG: nitrilase family protein [Prevotellaceae bacterium]|nr:nitrilase family protein [Prevotellaceae bacterium]
MKVTLIQMDITWGADGEHRGSLQRNQETAGRAMLSAEKSDLYVLPEMWNTGFVTVPESVAEPEDGDTLLWMQQMADRLDAAVAGSIAVREHDSARGFQYRNRLYFVMPRRKDDTTEHRTRDTTEEVNARWYDKHHLFTYGGEHLHYVAGSEQTTVEWRGVRFRLCTCYDLRFPLWLRCHDDYDALLCVASWPASRIHAWRILLQARAIENQCYVLGVNRIGCDPICQYIGGTAFVNPYGQMEACQENKADVLTRDIDMDHLRTFRKKFPVLEDADDIGLLTL